MMNSKRVYGSIALWAFIGLFYAFAMVGRADNFLLDDMYLKAPLSTFEANSTGGLPP
jgi:hypothetical protein